MNVEVLKFAHDAELAGEVAARWLERIHQAHQASSRHTAALSGGRIARPFLAAVASRVIAQRTPLDHVHLFWADERCVPPDDPESNYRLAAEAFLQPVAFPPEQVHRIEGERSPEEAAQRAEADLRRTLGARQADLPALDLVFLGLGEDGHVASLFPGAGIAAEAVDRTLVAVTGPKPPPNRVTLTYAAIAAAREVWVLVAGAGKQPALEQSLAPNGRTPLARVIANRPATILFVSETAGLGSGQ